MLVPFEKYSLITSISPEEVHDRLAASVDTSKSLFHASRGNKSYYGQVSQFSFKIQRKITYRNSFLPVVKGQVSSFAGQTRIDIQMRPHVAVSVFMLVWLTFTGIACIAVSLVLIQRLMNSDDTKFNPALLTPYAMFIFGYALVTFGFKSESKIAKKFLADLLEGRKQ